MKKKYRAAIIGSSGQGNYGHGLDRVFSDLDHVELVAIADINPIGLQQAGQQLKPSNLYRDYQKMLKTEKPELVSIAPGWVTERLAMVEASASVGSHIYCEKPVASELAEVDKMAKACDSANIKMAIAHQWRAMPAIQKAIIDVKSNKYGQLLRMWARPKDDSRGGGEELLLHGTHLFDLMIAFAGLPRWVTGHILQDRRSATMSDTRQGTQPVGPIMGDSISATFGFDDGIRGYFESTANLVIPNQSKFSNLFGLSLECELARIELREPGNYFVYPAPRCLPDQTHLGWEKILVPGWHDLYDEERLWKIFLHLGNQVLIQDLIESIEENQEPLSSMQNAIYISEMVQGVYLSHVSNGCRLKIPLQDRVHPLLNTQN